MSTTLKDSKPQWLESAPRSNDPAGLPAWYQEYRDAQWDKFLQLDVPSRLHEGWRFADLKKSRFEALSAPSSNTAVDSERVAAARPEKTAAHFVFVNQQLVESHTENLPEGVICQNFTDALADHGDCMQAFVTADRERLDTEKFAALNASATNYGAALCVPDGVELDQPIIIQHFIDGDSAPVFPRTLFVGGANSKATLVEVFETLDDSSAALIIGVADVIAKDGAKLDYLCVQDLNTSSKQVHLGTNCAHKDATINAGFVNVGGAWVRNESINRMMDTGSHTEVYAANLATGIQEFDQRTLQIHEAQHTTSNLLFKNALYDKSRCIFGGLIQVREGAHHTDSYQTCRNLLGSDDAEANAMPGLEIGADQVKCSHGSTSGQISDEEIFYLQARGIPADEARQMISFGFLNETLDAISCDDLQEWAANRIAQKFARI